MIIIIFFLYPTTNEYLQKVMEFDSKRNFIGLSTLSEILTTILYHLMVISHNSIPCAFANPPSLSSIDVLANLYLVQKWHRFNT